MDSLPFRVGQHVETRSFQAGYRGAWFRCEIKEAGQKGFGLEYFDYPDEKLRWMRVVYQKPPWRKSGEKRLLMLRPQYPQVYFEDDVPDINTLSEIIVVRDGAWKVGDLVDWFCEGAYWSGTITEIRGENKVKIELHPRPLGEGSSYEALCKNLRPSLEWSLNFGWSLPVPKGGDNGRICARLIQPIRSDLVDAKTKGAEVTAEVSPEVYVSTSSCSSALPTLKIFQIKQGSPTKQSCLTTKEERLEAPKVKADLEVRGSNVAKRSYSNSVSCTDIKFNGSANIEEAPEEKADLEVRGSNAAKRSYSNSVSSTDIKASIGVEGNGYANIEEASENGSSKRARKSEYIQLDGSIKCMLIGLEELLCKIKSVNRKIKSSEESAGTE